MSRVPPSFATEPDLQVSAEPARTIDLDDNDLLMSLIETQLGASPPTPQNIGSATASVLNPDGSGGTYPPSVLETIVPWWAGFLATTRGAAANPAAVALLRQICHDTLSYTIAGYEAGLLPLRQPGRQAYTARPLRRSAVAEAVGS